VLLEHLQYIAVALLWLLFGGAVTLIFLVILYFVSAIRSL
jgi:hypothetical protein